MGGARRAQVLRRRGQAGAQDHQDVVPLDAGAPRQLAGRAGRMVGGIAHAGHGSGVTRPPRP